MPTQFRDIKAFVIIGILIAITITGPALAIAYLQKPPTTEDKKVALGYTALGFQVVISILLVLPLVFLSHGLMTDKTVKLPKKINLSHLMTALTIGVILIPFFCMIIGNILFYVSYFDKTKKDDKQFDNLVTGFQSTIFLYVGAIMLGIITIPCILSGRRDACI